MMAVVRSMFNTTPHVAPIATSSSALQNTSPSMAGRNNTAAQPRPNRDSNGSISVVNSNWRISPGEDDSSQDQAEAEADPALNPAARPNCVFSTVPSK